MAKDVTEKLEKRILELRGIEGLGYEKIAEVISNENPQQYSHMWVKRWLDKNDDKLAQFIAQDSTIRDKYVAQIKRMDEEIEKISTELWKTYEQSKTVNEKVRVLKTLLEKIKVIQNKQRSLSDKVTNQTTYNILNVNEQLEKLSLEQLKKLLKKKEKEEMKQYA